MTDTPEHPTTADYLNRAEREAQYWREQADKLAEALEEMRHAVCGETGFAAAVRGDAGLGYPWPALDNAETLATQALAAFNAERLR